MKYPLPPQRPLEQPLFPSVFGDYYRDPANARRELREARGEASLAWITSHSFRKTTATILDEAGLSARAVADHLGHSRLSMTQDVYMGRRVLNGRAADALESAVPEPEGEEKCSKLCHRRGQGQPVAV